GNPSSGIGSVSGSPHVRLSNTHTSTASSGQRPVSIPEASSTLVCRTDAPFFPDNDSQSHKAPSELNIWTLSGLSTLRPANRRQRTASAGPLPRSFILSANRYWAGCNARGAPVAACLAAGRRLITPQAPAACRQSARIVQSSSSGKQAAREMDRALLMTCDATADSIVLGFSLLLVDGIESRCLLMSISFYRSLGNL
ncbi:hypothetical protein BaRGS_00034554, partial [Batillaria attramentaria]